MKVLAKKVYVSERPILLLTAFLILGLGIGVKIGRYQEAIRQESICPDNCVPTIDCHHIEDCYIME